MYYALNIYPRLDPDVEQRIAEIRDDFDPTASFAKPHITVLFPTPARVGKGALIRHIEGVLTAFAPFAIELSGFHKSRDHWLFITLKAGEAEVKRMYQALYSGILTEFGRDVSRFVPHLGLGLFLRQGVNYDWNNPRKSDLDEKRYREALRRAESLPLPAGFVVEKLWMTSLPDSLLRWATGREARFPTDAKVTQLREFRLLDSL